MKWVIVLLSIVTLCMNAAGIFGTKTMMAEDGYFPFPATAPLLTTSLMFFALVLYKHFYVGPWSEEEKQMFRNPYMWMHMLAFGFFFGLTTGFAALSIVEQDIAMKEIIESTQPLFTLASFLLLEKQTSAFWPTVSIFITVIGVACTVLETPQMSWMGFLYSLIILVSNAFVSSLVSLMQREFPLLDTFKLLLFSSSVVVMTILPVAMWNEGAAFFMYVIDFPGHVASAVLGSAITLIVYQFCHLKLLELTSSVYVSMVYSLKTEIVVLISIVWGESVFPSIGKWFGIALASIGFFMYNITSHSSPKVPSI